MNTRRNLLAGIGAAALTMMARPAAAEPTRHSGHGAGYFPNVTLRTHEGKEVKFYDDLIRGKLVAINMMYAQCEGICPGMTRNLARVQKQLGDRVGRDVFMYSISLLPEQDTSERLKEYADMHHVGPGWLFLTGARADIETVRYALGFYDVDPEVDGDRSQHTGMVRIGNEPLNRWSMAPALGEPDSITQAILSIQSGLACPKYTCEPGDRPTEPLRRASDSS
jgi:protein SCO1